MSGKIELSEAEREELHGWLRIEGHTTWLEAETAYAAVERIVAARVQQAEAKVLRLMAARDVYRKNAEADRAEVERLRERVEAVTALVDSWPTGDNGQDYRTAVTQCARAVRAALDGP